MIEPRWVNVYGYVFLVIIVAMLALVWFQLVPRPMYLPLFLVALVLYLVRITLRLMLDRQRRLQGRDKVGNAGSAGDEKKEVK
jgi:hypothetical protein